MKKLFSSVFLSLLVVVGAFQGQNVPATPSQNPKDGPAAAAPLPGENQIDSNDPLLQPPPLPPGKATLVGGTAGKLDKVRQTLVVHPFGGKSMKVYFDERTHIFRDGVETTMLGIHLGDRIYVDTMTDGEHVFARNIRVRGQASLAELRGQVLHYNARAGKIEIRDELSDEALYLALPPDAVIRRKGESTSIHDLPPGSLVRVRFDPDQGVAREIEVDATPGSSFVFVGEIVYLDMSRGVLALRNRANDTSYEIYFGPHMAGVDRLGMGQRATITATFDGRRYTAVRLEFD
jgi:hypothetical protein